MMTRWLAYIRLFDFHVKHIPSNKNGGADALSRHGPGPDHSHEDEDEADDYFDTKLYSIQASDRSTNRSLYSPTARIYLHDADYEGDDLTLGRYLETLQRPEGMTDQQFSDFGRSHVPFSFTIDICSKDLGSAETLLGELLGNQSSGRRFFVNSMMKMDTLDSKEPTINCTDDINGRKCTMTSSNMSNPAKDVSADHEPDKRNPYIRHGV